MTPWTPWHRTAHPTKSCTAREADYPACMRAEIGAASKVSVVIPTFNRAKQVVAAIESVLSQPGADLEVLVVDDGSTDDTAKVLMAYRDEPRVRVMTHSTNRGVTSAKNTGLAAVSDDAAWLGILDSDDILVPNAIGAMLAGLRETKPLPSQIIGWCADAATGTPTGQMLNQGASVTYEDALCGRFAGEFWHLARGDLLRGRRFEERGAGGESSVWWPLLRESPGLLVPQVVRIYDRSGADRVSITRYTPGHALGSMWALHAVLDAVGADMLTACPKRYGAFVAEMSKWAAFAGQRAIARRSAREALRHAPSLRSLLFNLLAVSPTWLVRLLVKGAARRRGRI